MAGASGKREKCSPFRSDSTKGERERMGGEMWMSE